MNRVGHCPENSQRLSGRVDEAVHFSVCLDIAFPSFAGIADIDINIKTVIVTHESASSACTLDPGFTLRVLEYFHLVKVNVS